MLYRVDVTYTIITTGTMEIDATTPEQACIDASRLLDGEWRRDPTNWYNVVERLDTESTSHEIEVENPALI